MNATIAPPQLTAIHCRTCTRVLLLIAPGVFRRAVTVVCPDCGRERTLPPIGAAEQPVVDRVWYTESAPV